MATLVVWHGYLLGGTGSNIYSANIVDSWVRAGHHVVLMCQDPHPERHSFIHSYERVDGERVVDRRDLVAGGAAARLREGAGACTMVQADIDRLLPVYLLDRYPGFDEVVRFVDLDDRRIARYCERYADAMRGVVARHRPHGVLVNHAVMGPPALRGVLDEAGVPYVVKIHGSELEYAIAGDERFVEPAREGLAGARRVLVGSAHIARRMDELLGDECSAGRVELVPPGVDLERFAPVGDDPMARAAALQDLSHLLEGREQSSHGRTPELTAGIEHALDIGREGLVARIAALQGSYQERDPEIGAAARIAGIDLRREPLVAFVGKTIRQKGAQLLVAAMPLIARDVPTVRFVLVGFGQLRDGLEALLLAIARGDRALVDELVAHGNTLDGGPDEPMRFLPPFLDRAWDDDYVAAAASLPDRVTFTGQVDHEVLARLWPLCATSVVPSIAAEAFGMVSAEAAACGCPPVVAHHSGLADVAEALEAGYPDWARGLASFTLDAADPVGELAQRITRLCMLPPAERAQLAAAARAVVEAEWSWPAIAVRIAGMFDAVPAPTGTG